MGANPMKRHLSSDGRSVDPNPNRWEFIRAAQTGDHLVVELHYPDAVNFEGRKVLLFRETTWGDLLHQAQIDPHFSNVADKRHPFARFEPTETGWAAANVMAVLLAAADRRTFTLST